MAMHQPNPDPQSVYPRTTRRGFSYGLVVVAGGIAVSLLIAASTNRHTRRAFRGRRVRPNYVRPARGRAKSRDYRLLVATGAPGVKSFWNKGDFQAGAATPFVRVTRRSHWRSAATAGHVYVATKSGLENVAKLKAVRELRFDQNVGTDQTLKDVAQLKSLRSLWLSGNMTGEGLKHLTKLNELRHVHLGRRVTTRGLERLMGLKSVKEVSFSMSRLDSAGINVLTGMGLESLRLNQVTLTGRRSNQRWPANLKDLQLINCRWVRDKDLYAMVQSASLESLVLYKTDVTNNGIRRLVSRVGSLKRLWIDSRRRINDSCMEHLSRLSDLEELILQLPQLHQWGFEKFAAFAHPKLERLHLIQTQVPQYGIDAFSRRRPDCKVIY